MPQHKHYNMTNLNTCFPNIPFVYTGKASSAAARKVKKITYVRHLSATGSPLLLPKCNFWY